MTICPRTKPATVSCISRPSDLTSSRCCAGIQPSTAATISLLFTAFWILVVLSRPFRLWKGVLVGAMVGIATLAFITPIGREFFNFSITEATLWTSLAVGAVGALAIEIIYRTEPGMRTAAGT